METTIARILTRKRKHAPFVSPAVSISGVIDALEHDDIGALIVSSDGLHINGIISKRDVVRGLHRFGAIVLDQAARYLMTKKVITCSADDRVVDVMSKMNQNHIRHIPVVDRGKFIGLIGIGDVVRRRLNEVQHDADAMHDDIAHA